LVSPDWVSGLSLFTKTKKPGKFELFMPEGRGGRLIVAPVPTNRQFARKRGKRHPNSGVEKEKKRGNSVLASARGWWDTTKKPSLRQGSNQRSSTRSRRLLEGGERFTTEKDPRQHSNGIGFEKQCLREKGQSKTDARQKSSTQEKGKKHSSNPIICKSCSK